MVRTNPREPGDDIYEQYTIKKTYELATTVAAKKGNLYTFNNAGKLIALTVASSKVNLAKGVVQATAKVDAVTYATGNGPKVQCHVAGSWCILKSARANLPVQSRVVVDVNASDEIVEQSVDAIGTTTTLAYILGTIHEVLTPGTGNTVKTTTEAGDLIVVQMGVS